MHIEATTKVSKSFEAHAKILDEISGGQQAKPDWIRMQSRCRLDRLDAAKLREVLSRVHACTLRGFKANNVKFEADEDELAYWRNVAGAGLHDISELGWKKCYSLLYTSPSQRAQRGTRMPYTA